jgi:hypothetical protein
MNGIPAVICKDCTVKAKELLVSLGFPMPKEEL